MHDDAFINAFIVCEHMAAILRRIKRQRVLTLAHLILRKALPAEDVTLILPCLAISGRRL
ncbi:hypothetical protein [Janthinobacterium lividum]|jgi:hypothetical protein|uniref:Uncharacterized protein n=1 Tax=Janthinobacterium lividum TaxID=29581 RepID=A0A1E8PT10_9BURK|nr:hypothetical protein [Janthinobacterium lividum]OFJ49321.1 hypothetical protein BA896_010960 [Janthinobacterium lividum]